MSFPCRFTEQIKNTDKSIKFCQFGCSSRKDQNKNQFEMLLYHFIAIF